MKKFLLFILTPFLFTSCGVLQKSCDVIKFWQVDHPDNFIEETVEDWIKNETGKDIDLSPLSGDEKIGLSQEHIRQIQEADKEIHKKLNGKKINKTKSN